ncbi:hypothetical protein Pint_02093 [Pistacia integerrima]|uniref:Uncharacterized protein n=1 Tax=Pistacia integerrima TaxID=434235 RepID=A0ACC0ZPW7_9ROSI|nr:hypothetical protein Pint_02093 [Pistacia integerrima]
MAHKRSRDDEDETSEHRSNDEEGLFDGYSNDATPSPNVSDFIIKPIVTQSSGMTDMGSESKIKKMKVDGVSTVLALPKQDVKAKKMVFNNEVKGKVKNKMNTKRLSESEFLMPSLFKAAGKKLGTDFTTPDLGMCSSWLKEKMGGIWSEKAKEIDVKKKKWQQKMLELYVKKLELIQEETQLILDHLNSSN